MIGDGLVSPNRTEAGLKRLAGRSNPNQRFEDLLHRAKTARLPYDKECWLNIAFFLGEQYVEWGDTLSAVRRIDRPPNQKHLPRPVANKIKHFVLDEQSSVLQNRPTVDVLPASDDPGDISVSIAALAYLNWLADESVADFNEQLAIATLWALAGTEAYLKWIWDPHLHDGKGRGDIIACSPLDIYADPYAKQFSRARWVIHSQFMDVEQVYDVYGVDVPPQTVEKTDPTRVALQREMGMAPVLQGTTVNELWMKPNRRHPTGLFVTWTGHHTLVQPQNFPYEHGELPFTQIGSVMRPGTQHYTSIVSDLRTPQMELNKYHAQMIQVREAFSNPKWWIPSELELEEDPDDSPRQILRGVSNGGALKPELIMPATMPPNDAGAWIENEMMDVAGSHEVSQAQVPGRVDSAKAIELLKEDDNGRAQELLRTIRKSISIGYWQQLRLAQQFGDEEVIFQAYSREGFPETHRLMTTKLDAGMRIRVTMGTGLSSSRAARQEQLFNLWDQGIITDREIMAELLDLPISSVSPSNAFDIRTARNENLTIAGGIAVTPNSWDNHEIHLREHNDYRKTVDYQMLDENTKNMFEMHCELHDQLEIQQLGKQLQKQSMAAAVAQGAGFQQPQAPGPVQGQPGAAPPPGAAQQPGGSPPGGPAPGPRGAPGNGGTPPPGAEGAQEPHDLAAVRATPQAAAEYQNRYGGQLAKARQAS
ncbi:MAG: portal protein [Solirubrobacteraceae bacterium]